MVIKPRKWQGEALMVLDDKIAQGGNTFVLVASGGAGKTKFAFMAFDRLVKHHGFTKVVALSPTWTVKRGFVTTAAEFGYQLNMSAKIQNGVFDGCSLTYGGVDSSNLAAWVNEKTLVILDEPHHLEESKDSAWFQGVNKQLGNAGFVMLMTGTPWRSSSKARIPYCEYVPMGEGWQLKPDYSYSYGAALKDNTVAAANFRLCTGSVRWKDKRGEIIRQIGGFELLEEDEGKALKALTEFGGEFFKGMLNDALKGLAEKREEDSTYKMLILCPNIKHAKQTHEYLHAMGVNAALAVGDDNKSHQEIERFRKDRRSVIVSVMQIAEGTDIPKFKVILFMSLYRTLLFFFQVMYRAARKTKPEKESFLMYVPDIPTYRAFINAIQEEILHYQKDEKEKPEREEQEGREFPESDFVVRESVWEGSQELNPFQDIEINENPTILVDVFETERAECANLAKKFAHMLEDDGLPIGERISDIHRQVNDHIGVPRQEDMTTEQLQQKKEILKSWIES